MKNLFILKLGGSAITYKNKNILKSRTKVISNAIEEIKRAKAKTSLERAKRFVFEMEKLL